MTKQKGSTPIEAVVGFIDRMDEAEQELVRAVVCVDRLEASTNTATMIPLFPHHRSASGGTGRRSLRRAAACTSRCVTALDSTCHTR